MSRWVLALPTESWGIFLFMEFTKDELANEEWRDVVGYEGKYQVSNLGRVRSLNYMRTGRVQILKPKISKYGYSEVTLLNNGITKGHKVSRLVAFAFIPNPNNKPYIDHIDTNRHNDRVNNLHWVTHSENMRNPITYARCCSLAKTRNLGRKTSEKTKQILRELNLGEKNGFYGRKHREESLKKMREYKASEVYLRKVMKPISQYTLEGVKVRDWACAKYAEKELGGRCGTITQVALGKKKSYRGFIWRYADNPQEILDDFFKNR